MNQLEKIIDLEMLCLKMNNVLYDPQQFSAGQVVVFVPQRVAGVHHLEVRDEVRAVEAPVPDVAGERGDPRAAHEAADEADRAVALASGPIGERDAGQHDRTEDVG